MRHNSNQSPHSPRLDRSGFTLVEMMVVIVIIATLAVISGMMFSKMKRKAKAVAAIHSMQQVGTLVLGLSTERGKLPNEGAYPNPADEVPADTSWDGYVLAYMEATDVVPSTPPQVPLSYEGLFFHPNDTPDPIDTANVPTAKRTFVFLRTLSDMRLGSIPDPSGTAMLGEHPWRTDGRNRVGFKSASFMDIKALIPDPVTGNDLNPGGKFNFMFLDGHIETMTREDSVGKGSVTRPGGLWTLNPRD